MKFIKSFFFVCNRVNMYCTNQAREIIFNEYLMAVMQGHGWGFFYVVGVGISCSLQIMCDLSQHTLVI